MNELSKFLCENLHADDSADKKAWYSVSSALANGDHLELALDGKTLPDSLLSKIVALTWRCVNEKEIALLEISALNSEEFDLARLLSEMLNSTHNEVHIVTTNYDRVAEYACNSKGILFQTGFAPGYVQKWESTARVAFLHGGRKSRVAKIWKVHGSLDWFRTSDEKIVGLPVFKLPPSTLTPLIVTPGLNKYEKTHEDPFRTTINGADNALRNASGFLCVGFGFRDRHIHPKIIERCQEKNVPIVVLAKALTEEAKAFLSNKAGTRYLGIEATDHGSKVYSPAYPLGLELESGGLWTLSGFNKLVL